MATSRLVCKAWKNACDELASKTKEVQLHRLLNLLPGQKVMRSVGKSALVRSLCGVTKAELQLVCLEGGQTDPQITMAVNSLVVAAMPALQDLTIGIPSALAGDLDRVLPRTEHLTKLAVFFPDGWSSRDCSCFYAENALLSGILHLQNLQDLSLSELPLEVDLGTLGPWLAPGLTSLSLVFEPDCQDPAEQSLQHLSALHALQRLRVSGCLEGRQVLPPSLSRLVWLDLSGNSQASWDVTLEFSCAGATALQHLDISESMLVRWPDGLESLQSLTYLDMRGCLYEIVSPDGIMLPPRLEFLAWGAHPDTYVEQDPLALPSLTHLTAMRHLACRQCEAQQLVAALPMLHHLSFLDLHGCNLEDMELQLQPLSALVSLMLPGCWLSRAPPGLLACTRLTELDLSHNPLGDSQLSLKGLTRLQHIGLASCNLRVFPGLPEGGLPHLTFLSLHGNAISAHLPAQHKGLLELFPAMGMAEGTNKEHRKASGVERWKK